MILEVPFRNKDGKQERKKERKAETTMPYKENMENII